MMLVTSVTNDVAPKIRLFDNFYLYKFSLRVFFNFLHRRLDWHCLDSQNQSLSKNLEVEFSYRRIEMTCG